MENAVVDVNTLFGFWPKRQADISLDILVKVIEKAGINKAFALSARGIFYDFVAGNQETMRACQQHGQLIPVATVNPFRWIGCLDEARKLVESGIRLFRFFPQYQEWNIGVAPFRKLVDDVLAPSGVGLMIPAEMGITAIGEFAAKVDNPIIIEAFRYDRLAEALVVMGERSNVFVETHLINSPNFVQLLVSEGFGDRMIFGSYAPLAYAEAGLAPIQHASVAEAAKRSILGGNVGRVLGV